MGEALKFKEDYERKDYWYTVISGQIQARDLTRTAWLQSISALREMILQAKRDGIPTKDLVEWTGYSRQWLQQVTSITDDENTT